MIQRIERYFLLNHPLLWTSGLTAFVPLLFIILLFNIILSLTLSLSITSAPNISPIIYAELIIILAYHLSFIYVKGRWLLDFCQTFKKSLIVSLILTSNIVLFLLVTFLPQSVAKARLKPLFGNISAEPTKWDTYTLGVYSHNKIPYPHHSIDPILDVSTDSSVARVVASLMHLENQDLYYEVDETKSTSSFILNVFDGDVYKQGRIMKHRIFAKLDFHEILYNSDAPYKIFKNSLTIAKFDIKGKQLESNKSYDYCYYDDESNYRVYCYENMIIPNIIYSKLRNKLSGIESSVSTAYIRSELEKFDFIFTFSLFPTEDQDFHLSNFYIFFFLGIGYYLLLVKHLPDGDLSVNFTLSLLAVVLIFGISYLYNLSIVSRAFLIGKSILPIIIVLLLIIISLYLWFILLRINECTPESTRKIFFAFLFSIYIQFILCQYLFNVELLPTSLRLFLIFFILWISNAFLLNRLRIFEWLPRS
ncbi:hypothetical protein SAMN05216327_104146 [Dyadobacter sp. SG02]|uniref:hypothetical protein n=1 Tax=Dyadobacter sp. SG02 TaxID=1855291 RepID=UPI0008AEFDF5|nr:hypothetical protein [Dyadobacter sp. SG02]SEI83321.1 hypothetical protein SAMN05216327_104146 [Dyadobacter sp. SG02]